MHFVIIARESETGCEVRQKDMFIEGKSYQASNDKKKIKNQWSKIARRKTSFIDKNYGMETKCALDKKQRE